MKQSSLLILVLLTISLAAGSGGCSPAWYKRSADAQVHRILRDRTEQTLEYEPQIEAETTVPSQPSKKAYSKIPATPLPPKAPPLISPIDAELLYGPLGPEVFLMEMELFSGETEVAYGLDTAQLRREEQLRLGPPAPESMSLQMDLFAVLKYAIQHSRDYRTQMESVYLTTLDVTLQRHLFEPRPFVSQRFEYRGGQGDVNYESALAATTTAGVRQQLPYGGEIVAEALVTFVDTLNGQVTDGESAAVALSGTIPLLRGAGLVNLEPLILSERTLVYSIRDFENFRRGFLVDISTRYFNLLAQQNALYNRRLNYANLALLTERTEALFAAGRINFLEVQRSRQSLLTAENTLVDAMEAYQTALDEFKIVLGMPVEQAIQIVPIELQVRLPDMDLEDAAALARQYRLDLQTARDQIEDAQRGVKVGENLLLPDLDLFARGAITNPVDRPAIEIDDDTVTYSAGAEIDLPIDRVAERNAYRRSLIFLQQSMRDFEELESRVSAQARDAVRRMRAATITLDLQLAGIEVAERRLELANEQLKGGVAGRPADARDVVEAQSSLLSAQDLYDRARATLQIQILRYLRDTGTLRIDPDAGAFGHVMDRKAMKAENKQVSSR